MTVVSSGALLTHATLNALTSNGPIVTQLHGLTRHAPRLPSTAFSVTAAVAVAVASLTAVAALAVELEQPHPSLSIFHQWDCQMYKKIYTYISYLNNEKIKH
jgi:hypothetical protein